MRFSFTTRCVATALAWLPIVGCTAGDLRLTGRSCPCLDGWFCDPDANVCVQPDDGAIDIRSFKAGWSTRNWIRWEWELDGGKEDFASFELVIGQSREDVLTRENVRIVNGTENPELNHFSSPYSNEDDNLLASHTDDHAEKTTYFAQLIVTDAAGRKSFSRDIAQKRTLAKPVQSLEIFGDDPGRQGGVDPPCLGPREEEGIDGSVAYGFIHYCVNPPRGENVGPGVCAPVQQDDPPPQICWNNLKLLQTDGLAFELSEGDFNNAYLEFSLRIDAEPHAFWATVEIQDGENKVASFAPITYRADGGYRTHQVPLAAFGKSFESYQGRFDGMQIGGEWPHGTAVNIDEVYIRW